MTRCIECGRSAANQAVAQARVPLAGGLLVDGRLVLFENGQLVVGALDDALELLDELLIEGVCARVESLDRLLAGGDEDFEEGDGSLGFGVHACCLPRPAAPKRRAKGGAGVLPYREALEDSLASPPNFPEP